MIGLNVDERYRSAVMGLVLVGLGVGTVTSGGSWLVGAAGVAFGTWFALDAAAAARSGRSFADATCDPDEEPSSSEVMFEMQMLNLVTQELREGPKTPTELASACDLTESRTHDALDRLESMGNAYPLGEDASQRRWTLDESEFGVIAFVRGIATTVLSRVLLPVRELAGRA